MATFSCDSCGHSQQAPDKHIGRRAKCPICGESSSVLPNSSPESGEAVPETDSDANVIPRNFPPPLPEEPMTDAAPQPTEVTTGGPNPPTQSVVAPRAGVTHAQASLIIALLGIITVLQIVALIGVPLHVAPARTEWEYKIESPSDIRFDSQMTEYGREGWELVFARRATGGLGGVSYEMIFRRPKQSISQ